MRLRHTRWFGRPAPSPTPAAPAYPRIASAETPGPRTAPGDILFIEQAHGPGLRLLEVTPLTAITPQDLVQFALHAGWPEEDPLAASILGALRAYAPSSGAGHEPAGDWRWLPGRGLDGQLNGCRVLIGSASHLQESGLVLPDPVMAMLAARSADGPLFAFVGAWTAPAASQEPRGSLLGILKLARLESTPGEVPVSRDEAAVESTQTAEPPPAKRARWQAPAWTRRMPWRLIAAAVLLSGMVGLWGSALHVRPDEVVIIRRLGRPVAECSPGFHFRALWFLESTSRLQPRAWRGIRIQLGGANPAQTTTRPSIQPSPGHRAVSTPDPVLAYTSSPPAGPTPAGADPRLRLLRVEAAVDYEITDALAYVRLIGHADSLLEAAAESTLRELLAAVPFVPGERPLADYSDAWGSLLAGQSAVSSCGLRITRASINRIDLAPGNEESNVALAVRSLLDTRLDAEDILAQARSQAGQRLVDAHNQAARAVADAADEKSRRIETAQKEAARLMDLIASSGPSRQEPRLEAVRRFLMEQVPGRWKSVVKPELSRRGRLLLQKGNQTQASTIWIPLSSQPGGTEGARR